MGMPSRSKMKKVLKKIEADPNSDFFVPSSNLTPLDKFRFDLQQKFVKHSLNHELSRKEFAAILGIDEGKISKLLRNRIDEFSTDRLISLYSKINPKLKLKVS